MAKTFGRTTAAVAVVLGMLLVGCGDDGGSDKASSQATTTPASQDEGAGKRGGKLTQLGGSDVDFLDSGKSYYQTGYQVIYPTQRLLYAFKPEDSDKPVPDLAAADPEISDDKKTVTVKLRTGVKFGPPVNREVTSKDVKYAFERLFSINVGNPYVGYYQAIAGAPKAPTKGVKPLSGITTPDDTTVVFELTRPVGPVFASALAMVATAPVPEEYAEKYDAKNPSTYNTHVVSSGPYMVKNDSTGKLTGYKPGQSIELVRNPNWDRKASGDFRPAYLDEILLRTNATDAAVASRQVLDGDALVFDANPPANVLRDVVTKIKDQYAVVPGGGYRFFPLNTSVKPFDDINVRRAVLAGFDRDAARKARGGRYIGDLPTHFLPPDFPGFEEAGGFDGPGLDYLSKANEKGDLALAAKYFKKAGYASGKYEGGEELLMVGAGVDPAKAQAEVAKAQLEKLGFKVRLRLVAPDAAFTQWCQVPSKKVAVCAGVSWFKDFADPQTMIEPVFKGSIISETANSNMSELNDPKIDAAMEKASLLEGEERVKAWAEIDKMIVESAAAIPFVWDKSTLVRSKDVKGVANNYTSTWDFSFTSLG